MEVLNRRIDHILTTLISVATPASRALLCYTLLRGGWGVFGEGWTLEGLSIVALSLCNTAGHPRVDEGRWPLTEQGWLVR
jgi:hypothetical protein